MDRRTVLRLAATSAAALGTAAFGYVVAPQVVHAGISSQAARTQVLLSKPAPQAPKAVTLNEAWQLALDEGRAWSADASVVSLHSFDRTATGISSEPADAGSDGRRAGWEATLIAPSKPLLQLGVQIDGGLPVRSVAVPRAATQPPLIGKPVVDTSAAVAAVRASRPALEPANGRSHGYNFTLGTAESGRVVLSVVGTIRGMPAKVDFDAVSGKKIRMSVYAFAQGGILYSTDGGRTWQASNVAGVQVQKVAIIPNQPDGAYAAGITARAVTIAKTADGGRTWIQAGKLPDAAGPWVTDLTVGLLDGAVTLAAATLAAATPTGLWLSEDGGASWVQNTSLPSGAVQWVAATTAATGGALLASIASLSSPEHAGVYSSGNGKSWRQLLPTTCRLSLVNDGGAVVALDDAGATTAHLIIGDAATPLTLSIPALRVAGTVASGSPLLADSASALALSSDGGHRWTTVLQTNTTSIAVAPAGTGSVALAGGFRSGIFRSSDGARTWVPVVRSASAILPGSDEVGSLTFLSPNHVVAVQGGIQQWQSV